jgi:sugar diacid utilization regulator
VNKTNISIKLLWYNNNIKGGILLKKERLEVLIESSRLLNSSRDTQYILDHLLATSLEHIVSGDAAVIFLYNESTKFLEVKAMDGFDEEVSEVKLAPGESITGMTFSEQKSILLESNSAINEYTKSMSPENKNLLEYTYETLFPKINSSISCPLIFDDHCLGVIIVDSFSEIPMTNDDLEFLKSISIQATIAIQNRLALETQINQKNDLQKYTAIIEEQSKNQLFALRLSNQFTQMILSGSSISDLLNELSKMISLDIFLLDNFYNISHHSIEKSDLFGSIKKNRARISQTLSKISNSYYDLDNHSEKIYFYPIAISNEILGWLGVLSNTPLKDIKPILAIERFVLVIALELLKDYEKQQVEQSIRGNFLDEIIDYPTEDSLDRFSKQFGFNLNKSHKMLIFDWLGHERFLNLPPRYRFNYLRHIYDHLSVKFLKYFPNTLSFIQENKLIFVLEINKVTISNYSENLIDNLFNFENFPELKIHSNSDFAVGIGHSVSNPLLLSESLENARLAIKLGLDENILNPPSIPVFYFESLMIKGLLSHIPSREAKIFIHRVLGPLIDSKKNTHQTLFETLDVYIRSGCNWSFTRDSLSIHGNTLTHRLKRIQAILASDLSNYEDKLSIEIALELLRQF